MPAFSSLFYHFFHISIPLSDFVALHFAKGSHDVIHLEASDTTSKAIGKFRINTINVPDHGNIFDL